MGFEAHELPWALSHFRLERSKLQRAAYQNGGVRYYSSKRSQWRFDWVDESEKIHAGRYPCLLYAVAGMSKQFFSEISSSILARLKTKSTRYSTSCNTSMECLALNSILNCLLALRTILVPSKRGILLKRCVSSVSGLLYDLIGLYQQLTKALDKQYPGQWAINPGDGAFYGPKIDITISDALRRSFQCATIQLDFQLPERFNLKYRSAEDFGSSEKPASRPVIIHRAILGSLERFIAIITEHFAGKW